MFIKRIRIQIRAQHGRDRRKVRSIRAHVLETSAPLLDILSVLHLPLLVSQVVLKLDLLDVIVVAIAVVAAFSRVWRFAWIVVF